jgi:hypothetical protein
MARSENPASFVTLLQLDFPSNVFAWRQGWPGDLFHQRSSSDAICLGVLIPCFGISDFCPNEIIMSKKDRKAGAIFMIFREN